MDERLNGLVIPRHISVILDGNGRWAKKRGLPRKSGHIEGCKALEQILEDAARMGVGYFSVYAFSTENWKRSEDEVTALMNLFRYYGKKLLKVATANNIRVLMIGDKSRFAKDIIESIERLIDSTKDNTGMTFIMAANYGSRDEIVRGTKKLLEDYKAGKFEIDELSEDMISSYLDTAGIPDPDLLIRTSGEQRLSNFLLWQLAYSEFYFPEVLWPDFNKDELIKAIQQYNKRDRRFGGVK
ncbi:MAG: isoprenyl transferase [Lachnospiraceae bacterium]|nr:isoprenyl transferase [Lachnospiraceae bacterium]